MTGRQLTARYTLFAVFATFINLATQWASFRLYRGMSEFEIGILAGTAAGLMSKYLLDKFWIFGDHSLQIRRNLQSFFYYTMTGVFTTLIFWSFEGAFGFFTQSEVMRYLGALMGLSIGYFAKFHLDRRFVFRTRP